MDVLIEVAELDIIEVIEEVVGTIAVKLETRVVAPMVCVLDVAKLEVVGGTKVVAVVVDVETVLELAVEADETELVDGDVDALDDVVDEDIGAVDDVVAELVCVFDAAEVEIVESCLETVENVVVVDTTLVELIVVTLLLVAAMVETVVEVEVKVVALVVEVLVLIEGAAEDVVEHS